MTGDYEVVVTKWDSRIDEESEVSAIVETTGMAAETLQITVASVAVGNTHLHYRVYLRKPSIGTGFYRVLAGTGYVSAEMGFPLYSASPTVSTIIDVSDAVFENYILTAPRVGSKGLPPTTAAKYAAVYARRLFVADDTNLYWSELDHPDSFNPRSVEPISSPAGGRIVGLIPNGNGLQILTETARHSLVGGSDPKGWVIDVDDPDIGAISNSAITVYRKNIAMWSSEHGPVLIGPGGQVAYIGKDRIRDQVLEGSIAPTYYPYFTAAGHNGRILFGMVDSGQTRVQRFLVFNLEIGAWESTCWDPMDAASLFVSYTSAGQAQLYLGNYNGQLFRFFTEDGTDGVRDGTVRGTFTAASTSTGTITDLTATFDTTGAGLRERRVTLLDADGAVVDAARIRITGNTATALTLSSSFSTVSGDVYTYLIGGPLFRAETYWGHMGAPFIDKRFDVLYSEFRATAGVANLTTDVAFSWNALSNAEVATVDQANDLWDEAYWDLSYWDGASMLNRRTPIMRVGINYRIKVLNAYPNQGFTLTKLAVLARQLSDRYAGNITF
jgi:hypothetical protein